MRATEYFRRVGQSDASRNNKSTLYKVLYGGFSTWPSFAQNAYAKGFAQQKMLDCVELQRTLGVNRSLKQRLAVFAASGLADPVLPDFSGRRFTVFMRSGHSIDQQVKQKLEAKEAVHRNLLQRMLNSAFPHSGSGAAVLSGRLSASVSHSSNKPKCAHGKAVNEECIECERPTRQEPKL